MKHSILDALISLRPNTKWQLSGLEYSDLQWLDENQSCPTKKEIEDEINRLDLSFDMKKYQRERKLEYPSITDQLDMIYWDSVNNTNQWQQTISNIKIKYPK